MGDPDEVQRLFRANMAEKAAAAIEYRVRVCPRCRREHGTETCDSCAIPLPGPDAEVEE